MKKTFKLILSITIIMLLITFITVYIGGATLLGIVLDCIIAAIIIVGIVKLLSKD